MTVLYITGWVCSSTCAGLNETESRAGRTASSCGGVRPCRKGTPSEGRRWESSASRSEPSEEGTFNSVLFSNKLEIWTEGSEQAQRKHMYYTYSLNAIVKWKHMWKRITFSVPTRWLGRVSPSRVQFITMSRMTLKTSVSLYTRRSSGSARHETLPSLKLQTLFQQHTLKNRWEVSFQKS